MKMYRFDKILYRLHNKINLFFQTGDAWLKIQKNDSKTNIQKSSVNFHGCLALIKF